jgi:hypothetical protein
MRSAARLVLGLTMALAAVRAALFLGQAVILFGHPLEAHYLEAEMVHLAWRAGFGSTAGAALYPEVHDGSIYVTNFFGPLYFLVVGWTGRVLGADLEVLARVGRCVTLASAVLAALVAGLAAGRRYGRAPGWLASALALGSTPLMYFGAMVRPDVTADLLGFAGFLVAARPGGGGSLPVAGALLVAAVMTKQTAGAYAVAAVVALAVSGDTRAAVRLALGTGLALVVTIAALTASVTPGLVHGLFGEASSPIDPRLWRHFLGQLGRGAPELPFFAFAGLILWCRPPREPALAALAIVIAALDVLTARKMGSALNYYLGLRLVAALGAAALWGRIRDGLGGSWLPLAAGVLGALALIPSVAESARFFAATRAEATYFVSPRGRALLAAYRALFALAEDRRVSLLTDSGPIALHERERAAFVDPWLFRLLVTTGRLRPDAIEARLRDGDYDVVVATTDLDGPFSRAYPFSLPPGLIDAARSAYVRSFTVAADDPWHALYVYVPRAPRRPPPPGLDEVQRAAEDEAPPPGR